MVKIANPSDIGFSASVNNHESVLGAYGVIVAVPRPSGFRTGIENVLWTLLCNL